MLAEAGEVFRLYVSAGARPVAVRSIAAGGATSIQYLHPDHLGSIGQITDANRNWVQDVYFKPYGGVRWSQSGILGPDSDSATRRSYTGQYEEKSQWMGSLMHYKARYYSPFLHRFTQPDTIVPEPGNPQTLNRFTYTLSNPVGFVDPTGHGTECTNTSGLCDKPSVYFVGSGRATPKDYACVEGWGCFDMRHARQHPNPAGQAAYWQEFLALAKTGKPFEITLHHNGLGLELSITYTVHALDEGDYESVAMGIFMDFAYTMESLPYPTSSFDNYDLPSDYLGMVAAIRGKTADDMLYELGGAVRYYDNMDESKCLFPCNAQNRQFTPRPMSNGYVNIPWPDSMRIDGDTSHWARKPGGVL